MIVTSADIAQWVGSYLWPFVRLSAMFLVMPVIGSSFVSARIRILFAVGCTLAIAPMLPPPAPIDPVTLQGAIVGIQQVLIGVASGLILQMLIAIFLAAGQFIAIQMGLGFAMMVDPINGDQTVSLGLLYVFMVTLLFLIYDGHLMALQIMVESFKTLPVSERGLDSISFWSLVEWGGKIFSGGTLVALPAVASLFLVNIAMGVLARAAPQMNLFSVGFAIFIFIGLFAILLSLSSVLFQFQTELFSALSFFKQIVGVK